MLPAGHPGDRSRPVAPVRVGGYPSHSNIEWSGVIAWT